MPTNTNAYNSRVTDEALEKRFRDTFRSQGGAELVDDLYAQGVIVPVVDFTAAATGQQLATDLQTAWDFSTGHNTVSNTTTTLISNAGFWRVALNIFVQTSTTAARNGAVYLTDGLSSRPIWEFNTISTVSEQQDLEDNAEFVVFLRSGDSFVATSNNVSVILDISYRQIATVSGDLVNPSGFTSS